MNSVVKSVSKQTNVMLKSLPNVLHSITTALFISQLASAQHFASYLGLVPGEDSSGDDQNRLGITKAGNRHV